jgi:hypothetical protein
MKRVECECGRMVRLDRDDDSDRAICPYCGAKLARLEDEPAPAAAEAVAKGPEFNKALLIGAAAAILLLVVGGVTAVVLLKKDRPSKDIASQTTVDPDPTPKSKTDTKGDTSTPKAKDPLKGPFAIRLTGPRKKNDVREVTLKGASTTRFAIVEGDKKDFEPAKTTKFELECKIRTLDVDDAGREQAWELTVVGMSIKPPGGGKLPAPGAVVTAKLPKTPGSAELDFSAAAVELSEPVKALLTRAVGRRLGYWLTPDNDVLFGSAKPQMPGSMWAANEDALNAWYSGLTDVIWDRASGKLVEVVKAGPHVVVDMHVEAKAKIKDKSPAGVVPVGNATNELEAKVRYQLPLKEFQGPTQTVSEVKVITQDEGKNGVGSEESLREEFTLDIRYEERQGDKETRRQADKTP